MIPQDCRAVADALGSGISASLRAVDCAASASAEAAFGRLFGSQGALLPALTIALTLFVVLFAFALLTGRSRLSINALTPRMITLGMVLTFATSWVAYQSVVWNLAAGAPDYIASIVLGSEGSATQLFADKLDVIFTGLAQTAGDQAASAAQSTFSPPGLLWLGATLLLLGTVGLLATCKIALALLLALGPVFVVFALFDGTRGLFAGWLKGMVLLAFAPLFAVLAGSLMLELAVPVLNALFATPGTVEPRAAVAFFLIGAVHTALMVMVLKVCGTMVSGWSVFGFAATERASAADRAPSSAALVLASRGAAPSTGADSAASTGSLAANRQIRLPQTMLQPAAMPAPSAGETRRETRIMAAGPSSYSPSLGGAASRTRGIGSRFASAPRSDLRRADIRKNPL